MAQNTHRATFTRVIERRRELHNRRCQVAFDHNRAFQAHIALGFAFAGADHRFFILLGRQVDRRLVGSRINAAHIGVDTLRIHQHIIGRKAGKALKLANMIGHAKPGCQSRLGHQAANIDRARLAAPHRFAQLGDEQVGKNAFEQAARPKNDRVGLLDRIKRLPKDLPLVGYHTVAACID